MTSLQLFRSYTRQDVHAIFSPDSVFVPQAGTWGLHGIVEVPDRPRDYVFFVTFGQAQGTHQFEEFVTDDGVLSWQSQPRQGFDDRRIQNFIDHREEVNNIHLFLRANRRQAYTYFGRLKYLDHDPTRERPVYFQWQILDWPPPEHVRSLIAQTIASVHTYQLGESTVDYKLPKHKLIETMAPKRKNRGHMKIAPNLQSRAHRPDYIADQQANQELGLRGELLVLRTEQEKLTTAGRSDLAAKVRHVSVLENDTAGYDILSFEQDGTKRFIEVKTTRGALDADFFISANELAFARSHQELYHLYRLYDYSDELDSAKFYVVNGAPDANLHLRLVPTNFKVIVRNQGE